MPRPKQRHVSPPCPPRHPSKKQPWHRPHRVASRLDCRWPATPVAAERCDATRASQSAPTARLEVMSARRPTSDAKVPLLGRGSSQRGDVLVRHGSSSHRPYRKISSYLLDLWRMRQGLRRRNHSRSQESLLCNLGPVHRHQTGRSHVVLDTGTPREPATPRHTWTLGPLLLVELAPLDTKHTATAGRRSQTSRGSQGPTSKYQPHRLRHLQGKRESSRTLRQ
jgi:hypothetical protein